LLFIDFGALLALVLSWAAFVPSQPAPDSPKAFTAFAAPAGLPIELMRGDLADRLDVDPSTISLASYQEVTWPDACIGVTREGQICAQSLRAGYIALFEAAGQTYRYHGDGDGFVAASFVPAWLVSEPLPPEVAISGLGVKPLTP
jgi:hypothetical protein